MGSPEAQASLELTVWQRITIELLTLLPLVPRCVPPRLVLCSAKTYSRVHARPALCQLSHILSPETGF